MDSVEQALARIKRGAEELIVEEELVEKLKAGGGQILALWSKRSCANGSSNP